MEQVLLSTTVLASFLGGVVALLAPCCISVMLPAYFASSFRRRSQILGMTLVFATGVASVILPIALGASLLSRLLIEQHLIVFSVGGALMVVAGIAILAGWKFMLPMPARRGGGRGVGSVYSLGVFSGAASACCAPVLAGVVAVSGAVSSFPAAMAVGVAYVFGMVAPLCVLALVWDRRDWGASQWLNGRTVPLRPGGTRRVPLATALSGGLMIAMGVLTAALALRRPDMATDGWEVRVSAFLGHLAADIQRSISFLPGWASTAAIFAALLLLVVLAVRRPHARPRPSQRPAPTSDDGTVVHDSTVLDESAGPDAPTDHARIDVSRAAASANAEPSRSKESL